MAKAVNKVIYDGDTLIDLTADDVAEANVLSGKKFHKATGASATGSMTNNGAVSGTISTKAGTYTIPAGYHNGSGSVAISSAEQNKIIASNIKSGVTILGVAGSASTGKPEQTKSVTATTTAQTVSPDSGYTLSSVTVNPQTHNGSYPASSLFSNINNNDLGQNHNYRYVSTQGFYRQYDKTDTVTSNGKYTTLDYDSSLGGYGFVKYIQVEVPPPQIIQTSYGTCEAGKTYTNVIFSNSSFFDTRYFEATTSGYLKVLQPIDVNIFVTTLCGRNSSGTTEYGYLIVYKNGGSVLTIQGSSSTINPNGNIDLSLSTGDTISVATRCSSTSTSTRVRWYMKTTTRYSIDI